LDFHFMAILNPVLHYALRQLTRTPGITVTVVLLMALGVGANAVAFGLVDRLLLTPPVGIETPAQVRFVFVDRKARQKRTITDYVSYLDYLDFRATPSFEAAAFTTGRLTLGRGEGARSVTCGLVTAEYFPLLGTRPFQGRFFGAEEDREGAGGVVVLSHDFWQRHFAGGTDALGQVLVLGKSSYTVVGIAPPGFTGPSPEVTDLWLPMMVAAKEMVSGDWRTRRESTWPKLLVRIAPGVAPAVAEEEATNLFRRAREGSRDADPEARVMLLPLQRVRGHGVAGEVTVAFLLAAVTLLILAITAANVVNLLLVRALRHQHDFAIRLALGIPWRRLLLENAAYGALLAMLGGAGALLLAQWSGGVVRNLLLPNVAWPAGPTALRVVSLTFLLALAVGISTALIPAIHACRLNLATVLQGGGRIAGGRSRLRNVLVVTQVALSVVALVGACLFARSLTNIQNVDLGWDAEQVIAVSWERNPGLPPLSEAVQKDFVEQGRKRLRYLPGVEAVVASSTVPMQSSWALQVEVPGVPELPQLDSGGPYAHRVTEGFFTTVGLRLLQGRIFGPEDRVGTPPVVVVNETMARRYWPGGEALGQCLNLGGSAECTTVVGVVANARRQRILEGEQFQLYLPMEQGTVASIPTSAFMVRVAEGHDAAAVGQAARKALLERNPDLRQVSAVTLADRIAPQLRSWRQGAFLFTALAALALLVAGLGVYSLLAFQVASRHREFAVRATLGADPGRLRRYLYIHSLRLAGFGIGVGLLITWLARPTVETLLYGISAGDPGVYGGVAVALGLVTLCAGWIPALRAGRTDPALAMQEE
jgi:predicted permease